MAISGSFNTGSYNTGNGVRYLTFSWERDSYSVDKNTTTIKYKIVGAGGYTGYVLTRNIKCVIDGTTVYQTGTTAIKVYKGTVLKEGTITIKHDADGTRDFEASLEAGIYYTTVNCKGDDSWTLNTIPQKSTVSATNCDIGDITTITIKRASSSFTHTLTWSCAGLSGTFATKTANTTVKPTIPTTIFAKIPNDRTATMTITCETFNGSTSLGKSTCEIIVTVNEDDCKPALSFGSILDVNDISITLTGNNTKFVKGVSNAKISDVTVSANNSATIKSVQFINDKQTVDVDWAWLPAEAIIYGVTSGTFTIKATDSRGYVTSIPYAATMFEYFKPTLVVTANRETQTGDVVKAEYSGKWFNEGISNTFGLQYRIKQGNGSFGEWVDVVTVGTDGITTAFGEFEKTTNAYQGYFTLEESFDYREEYQIEFLVYDYVNDDITQICSIIRGVPVCDWGENDFNFNVPTTYKGKKLFYIVGDSIEIDINKLVISGYITNSGKSLHLQIPLIKPIFADGVEVSGLIHGRGINGYINGTTYENATIDLQGESDKYTSQAYITEAGIHLFFTFVSAIENAINNTPVTAAPYGTITITFT